MLPRRYSNLNDTQKGAFGEAYAKMAFALYGFDVYASDCDDRGIDFVAHRPEGHFYLVQVKTTGLSANPFIPKCKFQLNDKFLFVAIRLEEDHEPAIYLARGSEWATAQPCLGFNAGGGRAGPYYEFRFARKYAACLKRFTFASYAPTLA
jgi:hypothetical protein